MKNPFVLIGGLVLDPKEDPAMKIPRSVWVCASKSQRLAIRQHVRDTIVSRIQEYKQKQVSV